MKELPKNESEFNQMMESLDEQFKNMGIPIYARELRAGSEISRIFNIKIPIVGQEQAIPGDYIGASLSGHITKWYKERYGDKLIVSFSPGQIVVLIRKDPYRLTLPRIYGQVSLICDKTLKVYPETGVYNPILGKKIGVFNILNTIEGLTSTLANRLSENELKEIMDLFIKALDTFYKLEKKRDLKYLMEAKADFETAVNNILSNKPQFGQSKWASLQFVEKIMKGFLLYHLDRIPFTHNLTELNNLLIENGIDVIPEELINKIQCSPGIRYDGSLVNQDNAIKAHHASIELISLLLTN